jgi:hypothetical protein
LLEVANPHLAYQELSNNGFGVVQVSAQTLAVTFHQIPFDALEERRLDGELEENFHVERFRVKAGSARVERNIDGEWKRWEEATRGWV